MDTDIGVRRISIPAEVKAECSEFDGAGPKQEAASSDVVALQAVSVKGQNCNPVSHSNRGSLAEATTPADGRNIARGWKAVEAAREDQTQGAGAEAQNKELTLKQESPEFEDGVPSTVAGVTHLLPTVKAEVVECTAVLSCATPPLPSPHSEEGPEFNLPVAEGKSWSAGASPSPRRPPLTVGAFIVQCVACLKYRWMPNKLVYEFLREVSTRCPFICEDASAWRPDCSCAQPTDVTPGDTGFVWAVDRADISRPPFGWDRKVVIRGEGSVIFSDVYYFSPEGRLLRSMRDVTKYFDDHPEIQPSLASFNFSRPLPFGKKPWKRKRHDYE